MRRVLVRGAAVIGGAFLLVTAMSSTAGAMPPPKGGVGGRISGAIDRANQSVETAIFRAQRPFQP